MRIELDVLIAYMTLKTSFHLCVVGRTQSFVSVKRINRIDFYSFHNKSISCRNLLVKVRIFTFQYELLHFECVWLK
jgi:hypothetical protein